MDPFSLPFILVYAALLGITMKLADLFDEHGLKWFPGDKILFGLLWGFFGILLVWSRGDVANILFARILSYIPRKSLDYINHAIASIMIIIAFVWKAEFSPLLFFIFFAVFLIFGSLRDYYGKKSKTISKNSTFYMINEFALYHIIAALIYSIIINDYIVFLVFTVMQLSYNLVKYGFYWAGWTKEI